MSVEFGGFNTMFLLGVAEPTPGTLVVSIAGGVRQPIPRGERAGVDGVLQAPGRDCFAVEASGPVFEITWSGYAAYAVRNEAFTVGDPHDVPVGSPLRERSESPFLVFVRGSTVLAEEVLGGALRHWELVCVEHIVDVAAVQPPAVAAADGGSANRWAGTVFEPRLGLQQTSAPGTAP